MKQKDIPLILVAVFVAGIVSFVFTQLVFVPKKTKQQEVQIVPAISSEFNKPDSRVFNKNAIDPTQLIQIGDTSSGENKQPF